MKVLALSTLLVVGLYAAVPAFASTPVYNSKANSPAISSACGSSCDSKCTYESKCSSGCSSDSKSCSGCTSDNDSKPAAFDGRSWNSKLGSSRSETGLVDVMTPALRTECSKCSS